MPDGVVATQVRFAKLFTKTESGVHLEQTKGHYVCSISLKPVASIHGHSVESERERRRYVRLGDSLGSRTSLANRQAGHPQSPTWLLRLCRQRLRRIVQQAEASPWVREEVALAHRLSPTTGCGGSDMVCLGGG